MQQHKIKIIISGGGSGGHIFPAIAIANALKKKYSNIEILFVGAKGKMEMEKIPEAGYAIEGLYISGLQRNLSLKNLLLPFKIIISFMKANKIINNFKPDIAVGVGGYASGPLIKAVARKGIPVVIQEQNSYPGITNKILAKHANKIFVAYENMERYFPKSKIFITGNPIREDIINLKDKKEKAFEYFGLSQNKKTILIIGGSQGAKTINESIYKNLNLFNDNNLQLIWQTGKLYYDTAKKTVKNFEDRGIKVYEFITRMDYAYSAADLIVSRAGAIAISEICAVKKPAIFIPLPTAAEDHQTKNAMALVNKNAAVLITDYEARKKLGNEIIDLINNKNQLLRLKRNIGEMAFTNSADIIADEILKLV